jgi:hypothetical protein
MRKLLLSAFGASMLAIASAANAVVILPGAPLVGDPNTSFITTPNPVPAGFVGPIVATIGHTGIAGVSTGTAFSDTFAFTIGLTGMGNIGVGSGNITTGVAITDFLGSTDLDITSILVNGVLASLQLQDANHVNCSVRDIDPTVGTCGANEFWSANNVPITGGALNTIVVSGISRGLGSYGGNLTFTPAAAVPEPATWAMMLLGFAGIGWQFRRRRSATLAQFA